MPSPEAGVRTIPPPQTLRSGSGVDTPPAYKDALEARTSPRPTTPPPPTQRSSSGFDTSSASKDAMEALTTSPPQKPLSNSGVDTSPASKEAFVDPGISSAKSTIGDAAASRPSSPRHGGSPSAASRSPAPLSSPAVAETVPIGHGKAAADSRKEEGVVLVPSATRTTGDASAPPPPSPRRGGSPSTASRSQSSVSCRTTAEPVSNGHQNAAPDSPKEDQTTNSDAVKMTVPSDSKQQNQPKEDLDPNPMDQWERELDRREQEVEQREEAAMGRDKRQYDRWLQLAEWETDLRHTHYAVQQGHARLSKWVKEADADWTDRVTRVRIMEDELRCERLRLKAKEDEKKKEKDEEDEKRMLKEKQEKGKQKEDEDDEKELTHGCFWTGFFPWNYGRRACGDLEAGSSLKETLLTPQQPKSTPTPSGTPNPLTADATSMTMGTSKPKAKVYQFETRLCAPRFQRPTTYNVRACPGLDQSTFGSKDPQMVKISLCVLTRQAENFNESDLGSTIHETLKAVIAQYNASQLMTESELVNSEIRRVLTERARNFAISIDEVSITRLSFEKDFTRDTEETKQITAQEPEQDNRSPVVRSQEDDQIWNKRQLIYIFDLGTALGLIFLIRPWLPTGYDRWMLIAFAAIWGVGSVGLPIGLFGTSRFEKNWSRHVGRFISLCFSLLVIYAIYILTLHVTGTPPPTLSSSSFEIIDAAAADWRVTFWFCVIAVLVLLGHLYSWIRGCCTGGNRDNMP